MASVFAGLVLVTNLPLTASAATTPPASGQGLSGLSRALVATPTPTPKPVFTEPPVALAPGARDALGPSLPQIAPPSLQIAPPSLQIAPPLGVTNTADPTVCVSHMDPGLATLLGGALLCQDAIQQHWLVLVWDWYAYLTKDYNVSDIDGFRVYEKGPPGSYALVTTTSFHDAAKVAMFPLPPPPHFETAVGGKKSVHLHW